MCHRITVHQACGGARKFGRIGTFALYGRYRARLTYHRNVDKGQRFQWFRLCSDLEALYCSVSVVLLDESWLVAVCVVVFMWRYVFH